MVVVLIGPQRGAADHVRRSLGDVHPDQAGAVSTFSVRVHALRRGTMAVNAVLAVAE